MKGSAAGSCRAFLLPDKLNGAKKELSIKKSSHQQLERGLMLLVIFIKIEFLDSIDQLIGIVGIGGIAVFLQCPGGFLVIFGI